MPKRKVIKIDAEKCNGCRLCIPNCPEGALQIIDGKARLVSDLFCDGLGACLGYCPQGAIAIEEREAQDYDERKVMENIARQGENVTRAHLKHLQEHKANRYYAQAIAYLRDKGIEIPLNGESKHDNQLPCGCPGSSAVDLRNKVEAIKEKNDFAKVEPQLSNWPVQIKLMPENAPYFDNADLLIAADCVPFSYADFHQDLLKAKILLVGCPKLDNVAFYQEKVGEILKNNNIKSVTCAHMEVPCCFGLINMVKSAIFASGKDIPFKKVTISIKGEKLK